MTWLVKKKKEFGIYPDHIMVFYLLPEGKIGWAVVEAHMHAHVCAAVVVADKHSTNNTEATAHAASAQRG